MEGAFSLGQTGHFHKGITLLLKQMLFLSLGCIGMASEELIQLVKSTKVLLLPLPGLLDTGSFPEDDVREQRECEVPRFLSFEHGKFTEMLR